MDNRHHFFRSFVVVSRCVDGLLVASAAFLLPCLLFVLVADSALELVAAGSNHTRVRIQSRARVAPGGDLPSDSSPTLPELSRVETDDFPKPQVFSCLLGDCDPRKLALSYPPRYSRPPPSPTSI